MVINPPSKDGLLSAGGHSVTNTTMAHLSSLSSSCQTIDDQNTTAPSPPVDNNHFELPPDIGTKGNEEQTTTVLR